MTHYGLSGPRLKIYNDHAGEKIRQAVVADLENGLRGALVSDAGTPLLSDPGYKLVQDCLEKEIAVYPVPGANAILPALQLSGLPCEKFIFLGFIPPKSKARRQFLQQYAQCSAPMIIYESAKRLEKTLKDCRDVLGDRRGAVVREITKLYEETVREPLSALVAHYKEEGAPKGEIVLVIDKGEPSVPGEIEIDARLLSLMRDHTLKEAVEIVAQSGGLRKNEVYEKALSLKEQAKKKM